MLMFIFTALLIAGAVGWFTSRRTPAQVSPAPRTMSGPAYGTPTYGTPNYGTPDHGTPTYGGYSQQASPDLADTRAEASHWVDRLGGGITALEGLSSDNVAARQSVSEAAERHASARRQLAEAHTAKQIELAGRTAVEGLHYLRSARIAFGLDPGPEVPQDAAVPTVQGTRRVTVNDQEYVASAAPGQDTPYYYPGGQVQGRTVPAGWYSRPWWKTAMVAGGVGLGSMLVFDALFGNHHGGLHHGMGGFPGGLGGHGPGPGGPGGFFDGGPGGFLDGF